MEGEKAIWPDPLSEIETNLFFETALTRIKYSESI
jgi:hypothetical protein